MISSFFERFGFGPMWRPQAGQKSASACDGLEAVRALRRPRAAARRSARPRGAPGAACRANVVRDVHRRPRSAGRARCSGCSQSIQSVIASGWTSMSVTPPGALARDHLRADLAGAPRQHRAVLRGRRRRRAPTCRARRPAARTARRRRRGRGGRRRSLPKYCSACVDGVPGNARIGDGGAGAGAPRRGASGSGLGRSSSSRAAEPIRIRLDGRYLPCAPRAG